MARILADSEMETPSAAQNTRKRGRPRKSEMMQSSPIEEGKRRVDGAKMPSGQKRNVKRATLVRFDMLGPKRIVPDEGIDREWAEQKNETPEESCERVKREIQETAGTERAVRGWEEQYVVASTANPADERKKWSVIVKYAGYARPSILQVRGALPRALHTHFDDYMRRASYEDKIEAALTKKLGRKLFREKYPYRFAPKEKGFSESTFVTEKVTMSKTELRVFEWKVCREMDKVNQPHIWFLNWTSTAKPPPFFEVLHTLEPSKKVNHALKKCNDFDGIKCSSEGCEGACESMIGKSRKRGCECHTERKPGQKSDMTPIECTDNCGCDPKTCGNRVVQRGRQTELVAFFHPEKEWTIFAVKAFKKGDYVIEYTGEVLTHYEAMMRDDGTYFMDMPHARTSGNCEGKQHKKLIIDSSRKGSGAQFISHSCEPNLSLTPVYVERAGQWYSRMALVASRNIEAGEELSFDYFPGVQYTPGRGHINELFENCICGSAQCKFVGRLSEEDERLKARIADGTHKRQQREEAEKEGDSWSEGETDGEEENRERKKKTKPLREVRPRHKESSTKRLRGGESGAVEERENEGGMKMMKRAKKEKMIDQ